ncbi:MAG: hypothetical protein ABIP68_07190 [Ferruginibacter sp.]
MEIELSGILKWVFSVFITATGVTIIIAGAWNLFNYLLWELLIKTALRYLKMYKLFIHFLMYRKRYLKWQKKYEGKYEDGIND